MLAHARQCARSPVLLSRAHSRPKLRPSSSTLGAAWREQGRRGVWISFSVEAAFLVPVSLKEGFVPHHCNKEEFVCRRLAETLPVGLSGKADGRC